MSIASIVVKTDRQGSTRKLNDQKSKKSRVKLVKKKNLKLTRNYGLDLKANAQEDFTKLSGKIVGTKTQGKQGSGAHNQANNSKRAETGSKHGCHVAMGTTT